MIGRAGRPQFDTSGVAIIMTEQKNVVSFVVFVFLFTKKYKLFYYKKKIDTK